MMWLESASTLPFQLMESHSMYRTSCFESDESWLDEILFRQSLKELSDREKRILHLRFLKGKTQMEVAKEIGISQAQVSRLEKGAIEQIKSKNR